MSSFLTSAISFYATSLQRKFYTPDTNLQSDRSSAARVIWSTLAMSSTRRHPTLSQTYGERSEDPDLPPLATYLLRLMHTKKTNLCVSADVNTTAELLQLAEEVGDEICMLKTHCDIIDDFSEKTMRGLTEIAQRRKFLLFEDRKFLDIGNTVQQQYSRGVHSIVRWAHVVNAALFAGQSIVPALEASAEKAIAAHNTSVQTDISASPPRFTQGQDSLDIPKLDANNPDAGWTLDGEEGRSTDRSSRKQSVVSISTTISTKSESIGLRPALRLSRSESPREDDNEDDRRDIEAQLDDLGPPPFQRSLILLAQMSSKDNKFTPKYTADCVEQARQNRKFVMGFIAQESLNSEPDENFITMTPGVQLSAGGDALGQQYNTPEKVIGSAGSDIVIVGRGILAASDRRQTAHEYRKQAWAAYESRVSRKPR